MSRATSLPYILTGTKPYKYRLTRPWEEDLDEWEELIDVPRIRESTGNKWVHLYPPLIVSISSGYTWDGPSGPAIDTPTFMRASLVHDALYQLIREDYLPRSMRKHADHIMRVIAEQDGMGAARRWWTWAAVRMFGGRALRKESSW